MLGSIAIPGKKFIIIDGLGEIIFGGCEIIFPNLNLFFVLPNNDGLPISRKLSSVNLTGFTHILPVGF